MNRRRLLLLLVGCVLVAVTWLVWPRGEPPQMLLLPDGSTVTMVDATYGKNHSASAGTLRERLMAKLPAKLLPTWSRSLSMRATTERDTLVLWFFSTNMPTFNSGISSYSRIFGVDSNGVEVPTSRILAQTNSSGNGLLIGFAVEAFPRRGETVLLRLHPGYRSFVQAKMQRSVDLTLRNPKRSRAEPWHGAPTSLRVVNKEFECELTQCELDLTKGLVFPLKLEMRLVDKGGLSSEWKVQWIELEDSTGNFLREQFQGSRDRWHSDREIGSTGTAFAVPRSLLPGVGAWKVRAYVMRTSGFASNEVWEVRGIPLADGPAYGKQIWRTNIVGTAIELGSLRALNVPSASSLGSAWSSKRKITADDLLIVRLGSEDELSRTHLLTLQDDRGSPLGDTRALNGRLWKGWAREWDPASTSATIRLGVSPWRVVEFLVEPTVIDAKP